MNKFRLLLFILIPFSALAQSPVKPVKSPAKPQSQTQPAPGPTPVQRALQRTVTISTLPQPGERLDLTDALATAVEKNYQIKIARSQQLISVTNNVRANAGFAPLVTFGFQQNFLLQNFRQDFFGTTPPQRVYGAFNRNFTVGPTASYTLFNGYGRQITLARLGEVVRQSEAVTRANIEATLAQTTTAYYDVVRQLQRLIAFKQALDISRERLELARATYEVGTRSKVDFLSAQVDYNADSAALLAQEQSVRNAKIQINTLLVREPATEFAVRDTIIARTDINLDELRQSLNAQNPQVIQAIISQQIAALNTRLTRSALLPQIDALGNYAFNPVDNEAGFGARRGRNDGLIVGLRLSMPVYNGGNFRRQTTVAQINERVVADQLADLRLQLVAALEQTYQTYRNSLTLLNLEVQNYQIATQNIDIAYERYRVGNSTAVEFRDVQRNAVQAQTRLFDASFNAKAAEIELLRLSSTITKP